ncbi:Cw14 protein [Thalictrum thalictroides]|uniref:Cw14 protein n=1 Tax=Thalictrum thalictroides TaxID=46969 RepID=A0A7J6VYI8_THATH|nr:Cw14 protein [Thalictrum thalictroides]
MLDSPQINNQHLPPVSTEEKWFESVGRFDSDCEEDFQSAHNDSLSPHCFDGVSMSIVTPISNADHEKYDNVPCTASSDEQQKQGVHLTDSITLFPVNEVAKKYHTLKEILERYTVRVSQQSSITHFHIAGAFPLDLTKPVLERPIAGSQVPFFPREKKVFGSWSHIEPGSFKVRAENYLRDRKKAFSPNYAAYYPFGVDVFTSPRKVDHIARFVDLPHIDLHGMFPPILVVNVQIPLYSPSIFQSENDGEGMSVVIYFRLSESFSKEIASHFLENLRRVIDNEVEVKGTAAGATLPIRERLKILGRVANMDDLQLNAAERKLMQAYNGKPILSRPQHEFYLAEDYFEIDLDMHRFSYISRKGFDTFQDRLKHCILDVGLTIQGNKPEELPEQILCCIRLNGIDHRNYPQLGLVQKSL